MTQPAGKSQHFTDEEKEQLAKLREQLPDIIHEAEKQSKEPVSSSLWGVSLLDKDGADARFKVDELMEEEFPEFFKEVGYTYKRDKLGRPVTYNVYGGLDNKKVHDYNGVGLFSFDKDARAASKATIQVLSDNYPESLAVKIFSYVPSWGETVFNIVGRWLSEETKKKFVVVSKASAEKTLAEIIGKENLPEKGRCPRSPPDAPEAGVIDEKVDQIAQPAPTAAPEEDGVTGNTDGALASETAGMRIDDKAEESTKTEASSKTEEPTKNEDLVSTATTTATTS
ncbi:CRAL/TRIO domain-containing protein [Linderina pennispora]|uniref:CRAL/TRIO domain-containing protein n=1 Tax=Linderina pennispora TaxID=61395 RepID=A0A1Y1VYR5_9FUNG|nr:CRAL/TRIO domain-containing protein [Linderina pennispora]ORX65974.1 CRAL/TRIO domain-containing protein [Linderina pennispora]